MSEWKKVKVGEVCEISAGGDRPQIFSNHRTDKCRIPIYSNGIDNEGLYGFTDTPKNNGNAITITGRGANAGTVFYRKDPFLSIIRLLTLTPNSEIINAKYLFYLLKNKTFLSTGSAQPQITVPNISQFEIEFNPDIETQHRIATILSRYDSLIENYQKQIKLLEEAAQRLYKKWFIDLHFPRHENTNIIDGVPEGWEKKKVGDITPIITGKKDANFGTPDGEYPFFTCSQEPIKAPSFSFDCAAVLLAGNGDFNVKLYRGRFEAYQRTYVLSPYIDSHLYLLFYTISANMTKLAAGSSGSTIKFLTKGMIDGINLNVPNDEILRSFNKKVEPIQSSRESLQSQLRLLTEARDRLLPKLMSGEITI